MKPLRDIPEEEQRRNLEDGLFELCGPPVILYCGDEDEDEDGDS